MGPTLPLRSQNWNLACRYPTRWADKRSPNSNGQMVVILRTRCLESANWFNFIEEMNVEWLHCVDLSGTELWYYLSTHTILIVSVSFRNHHQLRGVSKGLRSPDVGGQKGQTLSGPEKGSIYRFTFYAAGQTAVHTVDCRLLHFADYWFLCANRSTRSSISGVITL